VVRADEHRPSCRLAILCSMLDMQTSLL
jgi:hypothetical protein